MLVLLIIFMVAAPLATVDVPVDLPSSTAQPQQARQADLSHLKADLTLAIGDNPVARRAACALAAATGATRTSASFCAATAPYPMAMSWG